MHTVEALPPSRSFGPRKLACGKGWLIFPSLILHRRSVYCESTNAVRNARTWVKRLGNGIELPRADRGVPGLVVGTERGEKPPWVPLHPHHHLFSLSDFLNARRYRCLYPEGVCLFAPISFGSIRCGGWLVCGARQAPKGLSNPLFTPAPRLWRRLWRESGGKSPDCRILPAAVVLSPVHQQAAAVAQLR